MSRLAEPQRGRSGPLRFGLLVAAVASSVGLSLLLAECGARLEHRLSQGEPFPKDAVRERLGTAEDADLVLRATPRAAREETPDEPRQIANKALHPYTGFVHDHARAPKSTNALGFPGFDPLVPPGPDEVRIVITGGSVALQLFKEGGRRLRRQLGAHPALAGKKIRLVALTLGGYKQPQQLMSVAWLLALGAHFDVVINLDGFNEIVLPYTENVPAGVHPAFPRSWQLYARKALDGAQLERLAAIDGLERRRRAWRERLGSGWPATSVFVLRVLDAIDTNLAVQIAEAEESLRAALHEGDLPYQVSGPPADFAGRRAPFPSLVALWERSSLQLERLCTANGIAYFHFLQPNQYVEGSKPFTPEERRSALRPAPFPLRTAVRRGYGPLRGAGARLSAGGVAFEDLTLLFQGESETVYRDSCCHFNTRGVDAMVDAIAARVGAALDATPAGS